MFRTVALFLLLTVFLQAEAQVWDAAARDMWWSGNQEAEGWRKAASSTMKELVQSYQPSPAGELSPALVGWFNHLRWVSLLPAEEFAKTGLTVDEFRALGANEALVRMFLNERRAQDQTVEALRILGELHRAAPEDVAVYPALAVAYALVFDAPFPENWPHHQVKKISWETQSGTPAERFVYYVGLDKNRKLDFSPTELSFTELKFLVDSRTSLEELNWARDEVKTTLGSFDRVFSSIRYDQSRLMNRQYDWPDAIPYRLEEIQARGGICVDQAYFGAAVGKARGIPTLFFSGQGASGGHAWYGYLKRNRSWDLDVGRYDNQNYPVGEARDPQTWEAVNDEQLKHFTEVVLQNPLYPAAEMLFYWAEANRDQAFYKASIDQVKSMVPAWIVGWRAEAEWMKRSKQPLEVQKEFYQKWSSQFAKLPDSRVEGQARLLELLTEAGDVEGARQVKAEVVRQNRRKRFDLGIGAAGEAIFEMLDKQDWGGAEREYKKIVRQFDAQGGGNLFYGVVQPFVLTCLEENQPKLAEDALEFASKKMPQQPGSILLKEFEELQEKVGVKK